MGFREMLAKANLDLNTIMKTGKMPAQQSRQTSNPPNYNQSNYNQYYRRNQQANTRQAIVMNGISCPSCGTQVSMTAQFCHRCGRKTR